LRGAHFERPYLVRESMVYCAIGYAVACTYI
jgi:hypothetical protein